MAHFAKLDESNVVLEVNVVNNDVLDPAAEETSGIVFLTDWSGGYTNWKQTSYNSTFRKHFAGIGFKYNTTLDAFVPPNPFPSWTLDETTCLWEAPVPYPTDDKPYTWDEANQVWVEIVLTES
jgi:hypothetical protein